MSVELQQPSPWYEDARSGSTKSLDSYFSSQNIELKSTAVEAELQAVLDAIDIASGKLGKRKSQQAKRDSLNTLRAFLSQRDAFMGEVTHPGFEQLQHDAAHWDKLYRQKQVGHGSYLGKEVIYLAKKLVGHDKVWLQQAESLFELQSTLSNTFAVCIDVEGTVDSRVGTLKRLVTQLPEVITTQNDVLENLKEKRKAAEENNNAEVLSDVKRMVTLVRFDQKQTISEAKEALDTLIEEVEVACAVAESPKSYDVRLQASEKALALAPVMESLLEAAKASISYDEQQVVGFQRQVAKAKIAQASVELARLSGLLAERSVDVGNLADKSLEEAQTTRDIIADVEDDLKVLNGEFDRLARELKDNASQQAILARRKMASELAAKVAPSVEAYEQYVLEPIEALIEPLKDYQAQLRIADNEAKKIEGPQRNQIAAVDKQQALCQAQLEHIEATLEALEMLEGALKDTPTANITLEDGSALNAGNVETLLKQPLLTQKSYHEQLAQYYRLHEVEGLLKARQADISALSDAVDLGVPNSAEGIVMLMVCDEQLALIEEFTALKALIDGPSSLVRGGVNTHVDVNELKSQAETQQTSVGNLQSRKRQYVWQQAKKSPLKLVVALLQVAFKPTVELPGAGELAESSASSTAVINKAMGAKTSRGGSSSKHDAVMSPQERSNNTFGTAQPPPVTQPVPRRNKGVRKENRGQGFLKKR